jgi:hypothetical protein
MRNRPPEDSQVSELSKRIKMLESAVSSLFELLLQAGVINESPSTPRNAIPKKRTLTPKKSVDQKPARRHSAPSKAAREEARASVEFLIFTTRTSDKERKTP